MKKKSQRIIIPIMLCLSLSGCTDAKNDNTSEDTSSQTENKEEFALQFVKGGQRAYGNENGYYYSRINYEDDAHGNPYQNIMYIDYETKKEVYLCNKSNCLHNDESCSSYVNVFGTFGLFTYADKLYQFVKEETSQEGASSLTNAFVPTLYVSDLDGTNRKKITTLASGTEFSESFVFGNGMVYKGIEKHELVKNSDGTMNDTLAENNLVAIDLTSGNYKELAKLGEKKISGAFEHDILLDEIEFASSDDENLNQLDLANLSFSTFNIDTKELQKAASIAYPESFVYDENIIYYVANNENIMRSLDLKSGTSTIYLENLPSLPNILYAYANHIICISSDQNGTYAFYAIDNQDKAVSDINLYLNDSNPNVEIDILAQLPNDFLVCTGYLTNREYVSWAGVEQNNVIGETFALISKKDYFSGQKNYKEIINTK